MMVTNLISNGNFENASLAPWFSHWPGEIIFSPHGKGFAIYLHEGGQIQQPLKKLPRHTRISFEARTEAPDDADNQVSFIVGLYGRLPDKNLWHYPVQGIAGPDWQSFSYSIDTPEKLENCGLCVALAHCLTGDGGQAQQHGRRGLAPLQLANFAVHTG